MTIEVKTHTPSLGATVRINDPLQLEPDPGLPLFLVCVELGASVEAGDTLGGHAERTASAFTGDAAEFQRFWELLARAGFPRGGDEAITGPARWKLGRQHAFRVDDEFPRIPPEGIPAAVQSVRFSLEVSALNQYAIDPDSVLDSEDGDLTR